MNINPLHGMNLDRFNPRVWLRAWLNRPTKREREMQAERERSFYWLMPKFGPDGSLELVKWFPSRQAGGGVG